MGTSALQETVCHLYTTPGDRGLFAPAQPVEDYIAWLCACYASATVPGGSEPLYFGVAQRANQLAYACKRRGLKIIYEGLYADQAEHFLSTLIATGKPPRR